MGAHPMWDPRKDLGRKLSRHLSYYILWGSCVSPIPNNPYDVSVSEGLLRCQPTKSHTYTEGQYFDQRFQLTVFTNDREAVEIS